MITHNIHNQFTGYLGNRMFQAAATIGIAVRNGMEWDFSPNGYFGSFRNFKSGLKTGAPGFVDINEAGFNYQEENLQVGRNYNILGYRQSEKYFSHCKDTVREAFTFNDAVTAKANAALVGLRERFVGKKLISVHIRLGDYLKYKDHHTCLVDTNYYKAATDLFGEDSVFVIFSDNPAAASDHFGRLGRQSAIAETVNAAADMCLMSMLDGHIIANSSFSWWGAYLSGKEAVSPCKQRWFGPAYKNEMNPNDIIPDSWKQIEF